MVPNCYAWALNLPAERLILPGRFAQSIRSSEARELAGLLNGGRATPQVIERLVELDGLSQVRGGQRSSTDGGWLCALYVRPSGDDGCDWHFVRQDRDGGWSHKPGLLAPERVEGSLPFVLRVGDVGLAVFRSVWHVDLAAAPAIRQVLSI